MADQLYLNLWFPSFSDAEMMPRTLSVMKQFPFSDQLPGVGYIAVHPLSFSEPVIFEEAYDYRTGPEEAAEQCAQFLHADYAYEFQTLWDLWIPKQEGDLDETWVLVPKPVTFYAFGKDFEEGSFKENGHVQIDLGLDTPYLYEEGDFTPIIASRIKSNVQKLVTFVLDVEKNCGISGRVLWSESEENIAQKLIAKLQKVQ